MERWDNGDMYMFINEQGLFTDDHIILKDAVKPRTRIRPN